MTLNKYFVNVASGVDRASVVTYSTQNPKKIYFVNDTHEIIVNGATFGGGDTDLALIKTAIGSMLNSVGTDGFKDITTKLSSLETNLLDETSSRQSDDADLLSKIGTKGTESTPSTGLYKEIENEVATAIANVVDNAPETFDTLKEIATWLANDDNKTAADIIADVKANKTAIGTKADGITVTTSTGLYKEIEDAVAGLQTNINSIKAVDVKTDAIAESTTSVAVSGTDVDAQIKSLATSIKTNVTAIASNATSISTNATSIATNTSDISTLKTNVATNTSDISTLKTNVATNTSDLSTVKSDLSTVKSDLEAWNMWEVISA